MHPGARAEPVLAAWGITTEGKPVFLGLAPGGSESTDAWSDFLEELKGRGLRSPLLIISDGAGGLINAAETSFAPSLRQRCLIHRARNLLAKVPAHAQGEVKAAYWAIFDTDDVDLEPGPQLVALVQARIDAFAEHYRPSYPSAAKCLLADREQLTAYLRFPAEHHKRIRHSNFIERRGWRGFTMTASGLRLLQDLRHALLDPPARLRPDTPTTNPASTDTGVAAA
jgi:putative transposase